MIKLKAYNINLDNANDEIDELEGKVSKLEEALSYFKELWRKFIDFLQDKFFSSNKYCEKFLKMSLIKKQIISKNVSIRITMQKLCNN